jgi:hypothetical protein
MEQLQVHNDSFDPLGVKEELIRFVNKRIEDLEEQLANHELSWGNGESSDRDERAEESHQWTLQKLRLRGSIYYHTEMSKFLQKKTLHFFLMENPDSTPEVWIYSAVVLPIELNSLLMHYFRVSVIEAQVQKARLGKRSAFSSQEVGRGVRSSFFATVKL